MNNGYDCLTELSYYYDNDKINKLVYNRIVELINNDRLNNIPHIKNIMYIKYNNIYDKNYLLVKLVFYCEDFEIFLDLNNEDSYTLKVSNFNNDGIDIQHTFSYNLDDLVIRLETLITLFIR